MAKLKKSDILEIVRLIPGYDPFATAGPDCWFDAAEALAHIAFFEEHIKHIEGAMAGQPFILEPWEQAIVGNLQGWRRKDKFGRTIRRYRECLIFVPRKNGKTPLIGGIALDELFCNPELGQQDYIAASTREQAGLLFRHCRGMIDQDDDLSQRCRVYGGTAPGGQSQSVVREERNSFLKIISSDTGTGKHGKNLNLAIVDELHEQQNRDLVDTLRTAMASANKPQPLLLYATTSDFERPGSICNEIHTYACKVRDGIIQDFKFFPVIYEASRDDDWTDPKVWAKANPNLNVSVSEEYLADECKKAQENPAIENTFKRLHLNIRTEQSERMIPMDLWDACSIELRELTGRDCFGGLDLATVSDIAALVLVYPDDDGSFDVQPFFWCPKETVERRVKAGYTFYADWAREGLIEVTDALRTTDYTRIRARANEIAEASNLVGVGYDPWNATHLATELQEEDGIQMVEFRQGYVSMNEPTKALLGGLANGTIRHGGHPVLRWMASNAAKKEDPAGNIKPDKAASGEKIDGIVATIMGLGLALRQISQQAPSLILC